MTTQSKLWRNVLISGDAYTAGIFGLHLFPSSEASRNRDNYVTWVQRILDKFAAHETSKALMNAIVSNNRGKKITIVPSRGPAYPEPRKKREVELPLTPHDVMCYAAAKEDDWKAAKPPGLQCDRDWEHPKDTSEEGTGRGSDCTVYYSPWVWPDQGNALCNEDQNAGNGADEVLLHELVHAMEQMEGKLDMCERYPPRNDPTYETDSIAEFYACLVANVYSSETGRQLRKDHNSFKVMPATVSAPSVFYARHSQPIIKFMSLYPRLGDALASLASIPFNPFYARTH